MYTHVHTHMHVHTHTHTHTHIHTHTDWACTTCSDFGFLFLTLSLQSVHVHECTHMCTHTCMCTHTQTGLVPLAVTLGSYFPHCEFHLLFLTTRCRCSVTVLSTKLLCCNTIPSVHSSSTLNKCSDRPSYKGYTVLLSIGWIMNIVTNFLLSVLCKRTTGPDLPQSLLIA